jgi:acyl-CoA thioesterase-1
MALRIHSGETLVFIGDSITDCSRREEGADPLGRGYVRLFASMLAVREPDARITIHNRGINGDRVNSGLPHIPNSGLTNRWETDVVALRPDWLSIGIGINDVTSNITPGVTPVTPDIYEKVYDGLLARTREALPACRFLLIDPFYMLVEGEALDETKAQVATLVPQYVEVVHRLSRKYSTQLVKTHDMFQELIRRHGGRTPFAAELVHPNETGHLAIAEAVYRALSA